MIPLRFLLRACGVALGLAILLTFVGAESGCDAGSSRNSGMVTTPVTTPEEAAAGEAYTSHKPKAKGKSSRARPLR